MKESNIQNVIDIKVCSNISKQSHFHQEVELIYLLEGELSLRVMEREYRMIRGDICVINSNEEHSMVSLGETMSVHIYITYQMISSVYNGVSSFFVCNSVHDDNESYEELRRLLDQLLKQKMLSEKNEAVKSAGFEILAAFYRMLAFLSSNFIRQTKTDIALTMQQKSQLRIMQINEYIMSHYSQPISLKTLSDDLYLSEGYLSRFFKKHYNMSFTAYLRQIRLANAMNELKYTDKPVLEIALDNGFSSVSFFNRVFKDEYGQTPSGARGQAKGQKREEPAFEAVVLNEKLEQFLYSVEEKEDQKKQIRAKDHTFQISDGKPISQFFNTAINIGEASDLLNYEVRQQLIQLKDNMHFQYVRFWSLFSSKVLMKKDAAVDYYNFNNIDNILDFLVENGLKPFFDMEEKTKRINKTHKDFLVLEDREKQIPSLPYWEDLIRQLITHLIRRYGLEEVNTWKMEVFFDGYRLEGLEPVDSFIQIFKCAYSIIKKYAPMFEVGGCGFFPDQLYHLERKGRRFFEEWIQKAPLPDFISVMLYAYDSDTEEMDHFEHKSEDPDYLKNSIIKLQDELRKSGLINRRIYITEWNLTVSDRNKLNDHCFQGAYIIRNIIDIYGMVDMLCYFTGTDLYTEHSDTVWLMHGGQGLLTRNGITKPSGFAFRFLKKLKPYFIEKSEHCLLTTDRRDQYSLVCHNMKDLNYYYYLQSEESFDWKKLWKNFTDNHPLILNIVLKGISNGEYQMVIQKVNDKSGSIQDIWADFDYLRDLSDAEIKYLRRAAVPRMIVKKTTVENECIRLELRMRPNEIAFVNLEKIR